MTILTIANKALDRIGLPQVSSLVGNTGDAMARAMLGFLNEEADDLLLEDPGWSFLISEHTFDTVAGKEDYAFPADFQRMINNTTWDRNQFWQVRGGITPQQWQVIRSGLYQSARLSSNFRIKQSPGGVGKSFYLDPIPESVRELVFEMTSIAWVVDGTTAIIAPSSDDNGVQFSEELMTLGLIWRYKSARNLPFSADFAKYKYLRDRLLAQDRAPPTLSLNAQPWRLPIGNVPDSGIGMP